MCRLDILKSHSGLARSATTARILTKLHTHVKDIIRRRPTQYEMFSTSSFSPRKAKVCTLDTLILHVCLARLSTTARIPTKVPTHVKNIIARRPMQYERCAMSTLSPRKANVRGLDTLKLHVCLARASTTTRIATKLYTRACYIPPRRPMQYARCATSTLSPRKANVRRLDTLKLHVCLARASTTARIATKLHTRA